MVWFRMDEVPQHVAILPVHSASPAVAWAALQVPPGRPVAIDGNVGR
jgi:hypothetical protein